MSANFPGDPWPYQNGWPQMPTFPFSQPTGWQCPVCGAVYSPTVMTCFKKHRKPRKPKADKT